MSAPWDWARWFRRRDANDAALDEEIRMHLQMAEADRVARGESPEQAHNAARREFGNVGHIKEVTRESWGGLWLERLAQDVRYAVRSLRRTPAFTIVAVLTLALGIGVNTAIFTVVDAILVRALPFRAADQLFAVTHVPVGKFWGHQTGMLDGQYVEFRARTRAFASTAAFTIAPVTLSGAGDAVRLSRASVSANFFDVLGASLALGRGFVPEEETTGRDLVAVIGDALWRERFSAGTNVVGRTMTLEGQRYTIVGVTRADFALPVEGQVWTPKQITLDKRNSYLLQVIGRLAPNVTVRQAQTELATISAPQDNVFIARGSATQFAHELAPIRDVLAGNSRQSLRLFCGAVVLVLLIACANLANLLLVRASSRRQEIAVRFALGAGRRRLIRQLLTESATIALVGGVLGVLLAWIALRTLVTLAPLGLIPRADLIHLDWRALAFTLALCMCTAFGFGLIPALHSTRAAVGASLADGARPIAGSRSRLQSVFVSTEIALAVLLLVSAGLLGRSFIKLRSIPLGFRPERVMSMSIDLPVARYASLPALHNFRERLLARLNAIPNSRVAAVNLRPMGPQQTTSDFTLADGRSVGRYFVDKPSVTPGYFDVMGIQLREGRDFTTADIGGAPGVAIVSSSVAHTVWPNMSPIGQRIAVPENPKDNDWLTIVGVVDDIVQEKIRVKSEGAIYLPLAQTNSRFLLERVSFVIRSSGDEAAISAAMRGAVRDLDSEVAVEGMGRLSTLIGDTVAEPLFQARLLGLFSSFALLLAAIGIYGVLAYAVVERTREIGVRIALGAAPGRVRSMILQRTALLAIPGLAIGLLTALIVTRALGSILFEVTPSDPATFISVAVVLLGVALLAAYLPARRASRVDPMVALRT
jgi:putative ABC transport system permease protein